MGLLVDRLTLPAWKAEYRFKLAQTMRTIITASDPIEKLELDEEALATTARNARANASEKSIIDAVHALLQQRAIDDIEQRDLLRTNLANLHIVQRRVQTYTDDLPIGESETEKRVLAIRDFLKDFISENFRPLGEAPDPLSSEWIDFWLLYLRYVRGLSLEDVKEWMTPRIRPKDVPGSGRTWRQWYRNARIRLAKRIYDAEKNYLLDQ